MITAEGALRDVLPTRSLAPTSHVQSWNNSAQRLPGMRGHGVSHFGSQQGAARPPTSDLATRPQMTRKCRFGWFAQQPAARRHHRWFPWQRAPLEKKAVHLMGKPWHPPRAPVSCTRCSHKQSALFLRELTFARQALHLDGLPSSIQRPPALPTGPLHAAQPQASRKRCWSVRRFCTVA